MSKNNIKTILNSKISVIYGGFAIRRGDVDQGKMSILGGAIIAAAPAVVYAFYKIFGLDSNSAVGVGTFS
jgi:uncharacterized membrane protein YozB (DUF420 family)